jgi:glycosyltransferase involved in cell wall biosynthesis
LRILFVHEVNYLEKPIFEMHEFPEYLADRGHEVGFVHFPEKWTKSQVRTTGFKKKIQGRVLDSSRITLFTPQNSSGSFFGRLKTALTFRSSFKKILADFRPDVVVSFSVPTSGWQAITICRKLRIPYIYRALDVSHLIRKSVFSKLVSTSERYINKTANHISANNPAMANYCIASGANPEIVTVDLPPIDLGHFRGAIENKAQTRAELGLRLEAQVFMYMGSFFYFSGLPEFLEEFSRSAKPEQRLLLIGGGEQTAELKKRVLELELEGKVIFTGFIPFKMLPKFLGAADIAVNTMRRTLVSNAAFPNKVIQYMAAGLPVVSTDLDGLRLTFGDLPGLKLVDTPAQVFRVASDLLADSKLRELGANNQEKVATIFSKDGAVSAFESLLVKTVGKNA